MKLANCAAVTSSLLLALAAGVVFGQSGAATPTPATPGEDVIWYIAPGGSSDIATCGHALDNPCDSLATVITGSTLFNLSGALCHVSDGPGDGRASTTVIFLEGENFVPPVCLTNWRNVRIVGREGVTIISDHPAQQGYFEFANSTNVTIEGLSFATSTSNRASLYFRESQSVTVRNCVISITAIASYGIRTEDCLGEVVFDGVTFFGNPSFINEGIFVQAALSINQGERDNFNGITASSSTLPAVQVTIRNCVFRDIASSDSQSVRRQKDSYRRVHNAGVGLVINFYAGAIDNYVLVENSLFHRLSVPASSGITVNYDSESGNNYVGFKDCNFTENSVRYGGGIASYFYNSPRDSVLEVENCTFLENSASFEGGGVLAVFLSEDVSNEVHISSSRFIRNYAQYGSGIFLFNSPAWFGSGPAEAVAQPLVIANITDCVFEENRALLREATVNTLRMSIGLNGSNTFTDNYGSAIVARSSLLYISGNLLFARNIGTTGAALKLYDISRLDMSAVEKAIFLQNKAIASGGAIYADDASTSLSAVEYNHTLAETRFNLCFARFGNEPGNPPREKERFIFDNNTAIEGGLTINAYNLRGCMVSNFVPTNISNNFLRLIGDDTIVFNNTEVLGVTSTGPSYLFFYGASTRCYKPVGNITYLLPNCSHNLLNDTFYVNPGLNCALEALVGGELDSYYGPGGALEPTVDKLITPWAGLETSWTEEPGSRRLQCVEEGKEVNPALLYLSPAPGEQFDLTIQLADQLLNYISSTIYVEVEHGVEEQPGVLLQLNGIQYAYNDKVYFTPNRAISGLAVVGLPGTEGRLKVVSESQILGDNLVLLIPFKLAQCPLGYYDPPGASTHEEVNELILTNFSMTQRIPSHQPLACHCFESPNVSVDFNSRLLSFSHTCINGYTVELNSVLWAGLIPTGEKHRDVTNHPSRVDCPEIPEDAEPVEDSLTQWLMEARKDQSARGQATDLTFDPVDVVPYEGAITPGGGAPVKCFEGLNVSELIDYNARVDSEFSIEFCTRGYCRGDVRSTWYLVDVDYPCSDHREGPLCGKCESGYAVTLYSTECRDCSDPPAYLPGLPLIISIFLGLMLVVGALWLNFGLSPNVDSFLFFVQGVAIILSGRTDYERYQYLAVFNPDFTFNMCITPSLDGFGRLLLQYVTPIYILLLVFAALVLTRIKGFAKYLGKHSFLQGVWFLFLVTYLNIANTTLEIIHCRIVGPQNGEHEFVLVHDASVNCYEGFHLPFAILALLLTIFFVIPLPIYLLIFMRFPKLKPLTDVYCSIYRDEYRMWVAWSLARRLLLVLIGVFVQDFIYRHFYLLIACIVILVIYVKTWPYKCKVDCHFGFFVSWMLVVVACVTQPDTYVYVDRTPGSSDFDSPNLFWSSLFVTIVISVGLCLVALEIYLRFRGKSTDHFFRNVVRPIIIQWKEDMKEAIGSITLRKKHCDEHELEESNSIIPRSVTLDATAYREPLLDSDYDTSDSSLNSTGRRKRGKRPPPHQPVRGRPTTTMVSGPERESGESGPDSGFANVSTFSNVV